MSRLVIHGLHLVQVHTAGLEVTPSSQEDFCMGNNLYVPLEPCEVAGTKQTRPCRVSNQLTEVGKPHTGKWDTQGLPTLVSVNSLSGS